MSEPRQRVQRGLAVVLLAMCAGLATTAQALLEDALQPIEMDWNESDIDLSSGLMILRGSDMEPASIRQGSMQITGAEIRIERDGEVITKVTATGNPARFQQQLTIGQEPLKASGLTMVFDNASQVLTIDEKAELLQAGIQTNGHHFEYSMTTQRLRAIRDPDGEQVRMVLPPPAQQ
jgi:lipopolysaccharide export system protein LptA